MTTDEPKTTEEAAARYVVRPHGAMRAEALVAALELVNGDPVTVIFRSAPMTMGVHPTTGQPVMGLARWNGIFRDVTSGLFVLEDPDDGARIAFPESEIILGKKKGAKRLAGN